MVDAPAWDLRLLVSGLAIGFIAMAVGVATANLPGFQTTVVSQGRSAVVVTPPGLMALDVLVVGSFFLSVAGIGLAGRSTRSEVPGRAPAAVPTRRQRERASKPWLTGRRHPRRTA